MLRKGNLHLHTDRSDGIYDPKQAILAYKEAGYDFLAVTDHWRFFEEAQSLSDDSFTVLNGCEFHFDSKNPIKSTHILCIEPTYAFEPHEAQTPLQTLQKISQSGGLSILAHPAWSLMDVHDVSSLSAVHGIEIWSAISDAYSGRGDSSTVIDGVAALGHRPSLFAVDDTHFYNLDQFGGWIMADVRANTREALMEALLKGRFYATMGPDIHTFERCGDQIVAETSKVQTIVFYSDVLFAADRVARAANDAPINQAVYNIKPEETFVRMACSDHKGRSAWSQIIDLRL